MTYLAPSRARRRYAHVGPASGSNQGSGADLADALHVLGELGLLAAQLRRRRQVLQGAAATDPEVRAARLDPVGEALQHFQQVGVVVLAMPQPAHEPHFLARQRAGDERRLGAAHHARAVMIEAGDDARLGLDRRAGNAALRVAPSAAHGAARISTATATTRPASSVSVTWPSPMPRRRRTASPRSEYTTSGLPIGFCTHPTSRIHTPCAKPVPIALTIASLAAKRIAR